VVVVASTDSFCLYACVCIYMSVCLHGCLYVSLSLSLCVCLCAAGYLSLSLSLSLCVDWHRAWARYCEYNKNKDALLSRDELLTMPELRDNPLRERIAHVFSADGSGNMSFDDFLDFLSVFNPSVCESHAQRQREIAPCERQREMAPSERQRERLAHRDRVRWPPVSDRER
jgi:hypothetical protein